MTRTRRIGRTALLAGAALALAGTLPAHALETVRVAGQLNRPIYAAAPEGDDRLFIVEQRGVIKILQDGEVLETPFLDIDDRVTNISGNDERGLLGLAFHPDYAENGEFFLNYTNNSSNTVIARYLVSPDDPNLALPDSEEILLTINQPYSNHNGGTLLFSPIDGTLFIGMGDGGSGGDPGNRAQRLDTLLGKMLRIDVDGAFPYEIPPDNPFVGEEGLDEIWSYGLRNPYRWSFDRATGDLYIGDVGQGDWEEVDFEPAADEGGRNYGWRRMEGNHCYNPPEDCNDGSLILPIHEYSHGGDPFRCSITGGSVYRGAAIPSLQGTYFFADFCSDQIWSFRYDGENLTEFQDRTAELDPGGGQAIGDIAAIVEDGFGELYVVDRAGTSSGEIYKILPDPAGVGDLPIGDAPHLSMARPNPSNAAVRLRLTLPHATTAQVAVVDVEGRRIRSLRSGRFGAGTETLVWDGNDATGRRVAAGVYFIRALVDGERLTRRIERID
ncbi:MAG: glucose dehydrogenase [Candidatus Eisenbacteria bacterium]|nr:glucose dehydrogenase [Candidatus Latescibacterota bacterium]MBD3302638.1 glucose dehydrogenase [Candidatus Eisenbacteria bacterium]